MSRHYIVVPKLLQPFFPGGAPPNWRDVAFDDATERGTSLTIERLAPNDDGVRVAIYGDRFYFEAGRDKYRNDTLFLFKILRADAMVRRSERRTFGAELVLWKDGTPPPADSVAFLFGIADEDAAGEQAPTAVPLSASPLLLSLLEQAPETLLSRFRPGSEEAEPVDVSDFIKMLNRVWVKHRLDRFSSLTPRQASMIRGLLRPPIMSREERDQLLAVLGFELLNASALALRGKLQEFVQLVDDLGASSLLTDVRTRIWVALMAKRSGSVVRRELHLAAASGHLRGALSRVPRGSLANVLRATADTDGDPAILQLADALNANDEGAIALEAWAGSLQFDVPESAIEVVVAAPEKLLDEPSSAVEETLVPALPAPMQIAVEVDDVVERWLLNRSVPDRPALSAALARVGELALEVGVIQAVESLASFSLASDLLHQVRREVDLCIGAVPDYADIELDIPAARAAYARAMAIIGPAVIGLLDAHPNVSPAELDRISDLFGRRELLASLPEWVWWAEEDDASPSPLDESAMAKAFGHPEVLGRVEVVVNSYDQLAYEQSLSWLQPPQPGSDVDAHIQQWFERSKEFLESAPAEVRTWLASGVISMAAFEVARTDAAHFGFLKERTSDPVFAAIQGEIQALPSAVERSQRVALYRSAVEVIGEQFDPRFAPFEMLRGWVATRGSMAAHSTVPDSEPQSDPVRIEHNFVLGGRRVSLTFVETTQQPSQGYVDVPLVLSTEWSSSPLSLRLEYDVKQGYGEAWYGDWPGVEPDSLDVPVYSWRPQPVQSHQRQRYHFSFRARLPVRRPKTEEAKFSVLVRAFDTATGKLMAESKRLDWDYVRAPELVQSTWSGTTLGEHVRSHPIGPQAQCDEMLGQLDATGSFTVIAPRRFGKTTLVHYLQREASTRGFLVPPPVLCTLFFKNGGLDIAGVWKQISDGLADHLGVGLIGIPNEGWPEKRGFDEARKRAKGRFKGIVLIFDEAQLLFPRANGPQSTLR